MIIAGAAVAASPKGALAAQEPTARTANLPMQSRSDEVLLAANHNGWPL